jgi:hypothetical protein
MRCSILALVVAGGLAAAGPAGAQMMGMGGSMGMGTNMRAQPDDPFGPGRLEYPSAQERYVDQLQRLRRKMLKITAQDGGQLTEAHRAAIQLELDAINRSYAANATRGGRR